MELDAPCTYSTLPVDYNATIVAPQLGNQFRFYGVSSGPGITITQTPTVVQVAQSPNIQAYSMFRSMGNDVTHVTGTALYPTLVISGPGQHDDGYYNGQAITIPMSRFYTIEIMLSYVGTNASVYLEDSNGIIIKQASSTYASLTGIHTPTTLTIAMSAPFLPSDVLRVRVTSNTAGQLLLSQSYVSIYTS